MIRHCSRCHAEHDDPGRYCRRCRANYMRDWRSSRPSNAYRNIHAVSCETVPRDDSEELAAAVADLCDEYVRAG